MGKIVGFDISPVLKADEIKSIATLHIQLADKLTLIIELDEQDIRCLRGLISAIPFIKDEYGAEVFSEEVS